MASQPQPRKEFWLVRLLRWPGKHWWWIAPTALLFFGLVSYLIQEWFPASGNVASILGLLISAVGFIVTIWTVLETQRIERQARDEIARALVDAGAAITAAQNETRDLIAQQRGRSLCEDAVRLLGEARSSIRDGLWRRAAEKLQDAGGVCLRLGGSVIVRSEERETLGAAVGSLQAVIRYIERNRLTQAGPTPSLPPVTLNPLRFSGSKCSAF